MPDDSKRLHRLINKLTLCALDHAHIDEFLRELSEYTGGISTHIHSHDFWAGEQLSVSGFGYSPDFITSYKQHFGTVNAWGAGMLKAPIGIPVSCEWMLPEALLRRTEFYNDWLRPQEDLLSGGGVILDKNRGRIVAIGGSIKARHVEALREPWLRTIGQLAPQLQTVFEISRRLQGLTLVEAVADYTNSRSLVVVTNDDDIALYCSRSIDAESGVPFFFDRGGRLRIRDEGAERIKNRQSRGVTSYDFTVAVDGVPLRYNYTLCDIYDHDDERLKYWAIVGDRERFRVHILSPRVAASRDTSQLAAKFGLTEREMEIASAIAEGLAPREIAERDAVSVHTVRNQLKAVMSKLGVRRQTGISRIIGNGE